MSFLASPGKFLQRNTKLSLSEAGRLLAQWADSNGGLAADFTDITASQPYGSMKIIDGATPANNWETSSSLTPFDKLTWTGASLRMCYGSDGVLRYAPHNFLVVTNDFSNAAWTASSCTKTSTTEIDPAGGTTGCLFTATATSNVFLINSAGGASGFTYETVVYAKAGTSSWLSISNGAYFVYFNLGAGTVGTVGDGTASITAAGNGYYRCAWQQADVSATGIARFRIVDGDGSTAVTVGRTLTIAFPQIHRTPVHSTDYIAATSGSAVYRPRIDYDPSTLAVRGLLVEEQRVNRLLYSSDFSNAAWVASNVTKTSNDAVGPFGTTTADLLTATAGNGTVIQDLGVVASAAKTGAIFIKRKTGTGNIDLTMDGGSTWTTKAVTTTWTRFDITQTLADEDFGIRIVTSGDEVWVEAADVQTGAFITSHIPTTSASATRAADAVSLATSAFNYGSSAITLYNEAQVGTATARNCGLLTVSGPDGDPSVGMRTEASNSRIYGIVTDGTLQAAILPTPTVTAGSTFKSAMGATANLVDCAVNGTLGTQDTSATYPAAQTLRMSGELAGSGFGVTWYRKVLQLPRKLSPTDLQTLTT